MIKKWKYQQNIEFQWDFYPTPACAQNYFKFVLICQADICNVYAEIEKPVICVRARWGVIFAICCVLSVSLALFLIVHVNTIDRWYISPLPPLWMPVWSAVSAPSGNFFQLVNWIGGGGEVHIL
jgi:hypothetical protein